MGFPRLRTFAALSLLAALIPAPSGAATLSRSACAALREKQKRDYAALVSELRSGYVEPLLGALRVYLDSYTAEDWNLLERKKAHDRAIARGWKILAWKAEIPGIKFPPDDEKFYDQFLHGEIPDDGLDSPVAPDRLEARFTKKTKGFSHEAYSSETCVKPKPDGSGQCWVSRSRTLSAPHLYADGSFSFSICDIVKNEADYTTRLRVCETVDLLAALPAKPVLPSSDEVLGKLVYNGRPVASYAPSDSDLPKECAPEPKTGEASKSGISRPAISSTKAVPAAGAESENSADGNPKALPAPQ